MLTVCSIVRSRLIIVPKKGWPQRVRFSGIFNVVPNFSVAPFCIEVQLLTNSSIFLIASSVAEMRQWIVALLADPELCESLTLDSFDKLKLIHDGLLSRVYLVRKKSSGRLHVLKSILKSASFQGSKALRERSALMKSNCPFIVKLHATFQTDRDFYIKDLNILPFKTPHDAAESVGFSFFAQGKRVSFLTDIGHTPERLLSAVDGSDLILIESNHDVDMLASGPYPYPLKRRIMGDNGHLSNEGCGAALAKLFSRGVSCAILGHLSKENNSEDIAMLTVRCTLREQDIPDGAFPLYIAHRDRTTGIFEVGQ
jgi:hypothetical protein